MIKRDSENITKIYIYISNTCCYFNPFYLLMNIYKSITVFFNIGRISKGSCDNES